MLWLLNTNATTAAAATTYDFLIYHTRYYSCVFLSKTKVQILVFSIVLDLIHVIEVVINELRFSCRESPMVKSYF